MPMRSHSRRKKSPVPVEPRLEGAVVLALVPGELRVHRAQRSHPQLLRPQHDTGPAVAAAGDPVRPDAGQRRRRPRHTRRPGRPSRAWGRRSRRRSARPPEPGCRRSTPPGARPRRGGPDGWRGSRPTSTGPRRGRWARAAPRPAARETRRPRGLGATGSRCRPARRAPPARATPRRPAPGRPPGRSTVGCG